MQLINKEDSFNVSEWMNFLKGLAIFEIVFFHFVADQSKSVVSSSAFVSDGFAQIYRIFDILILLGSRLGSQGIHVFFFLSGVGIALSERNRVLAWWEFLIRRLSKVYPPYVFSVFFVVILQLVLDMASWDVGYVQSILSNIFLVRNFSSEWIISINGNWWFVGTIVQMYFAYVLLRKRLIGGSIWLLVFMYGISFAYKMLLVFLVGNAWVSFDAGILNPYTSFFLNYWWEFVAGIVFVNTNSARYLREISVSGMSLLLIVAVFGEIGGWFLSQNFLGRLFNDDLFAISQIALLSFVYVLCGSLFGKRHWIKDVISYIGVSSYGLYLIHHPISKAIVNFGFGMPNTVFILALFFVYFPFSFLVGYGMEKSVRLTMRQQGK